MKVEAKTIEDYFSKAGDREADLRALDRLIVKAVPSQKRELFSGTTYNMIGYGIFHYKYASGREGDWPLIALASQKNYISLYVCVAKDGEYVAEKNKDKLGKVSVGRSCIRFKKLSDLDQDELIKVLKIAEQWSKDGFFAA